jgi:hypothetical protein
LLIGVWKDRYIFGHPRTFFDSPKKFSVHFKWLMQGGIGKCGCRNCKGPIMRNSSLPVAVPAAIASDPDINDLGAQLERLANYFEQNPDDMSEHIIAWEGPPRLGPHELLDGQSFQNLPTKYQTLPSFLPRKGELVIFYLEEELDCRFEEISQQFRVFNEASGEFLGFPTWRAGVIVAEPENKLGHEDLSTQPYDQLEATKKLFRIELYPDPESGDKSLSSKSYDSPLSRIRPLSLFHEFLSGVAQMEWHETIHNALKSMNTVCVVEPIEFAGKWFSYSIRCRGIWIGPELYVNGDAVRLLPARGNGTEVDQIMIINRIDHRFENDNVRDERSSIVVAGPVITINKNRSFKNTSFTVAEKQKLLLPASTAGYTWYPIDVSTDGHPPESNYEGFLDDWQEVPVSYIVGRLYDLEAMKILLNISNFDVGGLGMKRARRWAKKHRTTTKVNNHQEWILTVDRIEALDIEMLNGRAVGKGAGRENLGGHNGNRGRSKASPGEKYKNRVLLLGGSSNRSSNHYSGSSETGEVGDEGRKFEKALETSDMDENVQSDTSGQPARSFKSVVTDRTHDWTEDENEDENAEAFISEVIAENALLTEEGEMEEEIADGAQNGVSPQRERPAKRLRH